MGISTNEQAGRRSKHYRSAPDPAATIWRLPAVSNYTGLSRSTILRGPEGFPRSLKLSGHTVGWLRAEVEKWLADRIADRDGRAAQ